MKVIIAGGGTGGHLFPAVAVGEEIRRQRPETAVLYVGATNGLEARWMPRQGLPHELLQVRGWTGKDPLTRLRALREFFGAVRRARVLIAQFGANLVVGAGGYASAPVAVAAILKRVPLVLLEQNVRPGLSNRILWRLARKICVGFPDSAAAFSPTKAALTGNPVRFAISSTRRNGTGSIQILVLGGSTGAHRLNIGVLHAFKICPKSVIKLSITHQTGEADAGIVAEGYKELGLQAKVVPFIDDVASELAAADLIVARSGAMAVTEIALAGRPAIFVPYPFHRDRQQEFNARVVERRGGAVIVFDDEHLGENLATKLQQLTQDRDRLLQMGQAAASAAMPDAAAKVAAICFAEARI